VFSLSNSRISWERRSSWKVEWVTTWDYAFETSTRRSCIYVDGALMIYACRCFEVSRINTRNFGRWIIYFNLKTWYLNSLASTFVLLASCVSKRAIFGRLFQKCSLIESPQSTIQEILISLFTLHEILGFDILNTEKLFFHNEFSEIFYEKEV